MKRRSVMSKSIFVLAATLVLASIAMPPTVSVLLSFTAKTSQNKGKVYFGVSPLSQTEPWIEFQSLTTFETHARKHAAIANYFMNWDWSPLWVTQPLADRGTVPMITLQPWLGVCDANWTLQSFANGAHDAVAIRWAQELASYGGTVFLRWAHEMNQGMPFCWSIGINGNTAQDYIAAWRHLHDIFTAHRATNVKWVWSPNIFWDAASEFDAIYPGDAYVDWTGLDGYNWGTTRPWESWQTFSQLYQPSYELMRQIAPTKPLMIAEFSSAESGGDKAAWITQALTNEIPSMPNIKAVVWFNIIAEGVDWRIESSPAAQAAFANAVASSYYIANY
jgi:beta-mannanase